MPILEPRQAGFRTITRLMRRMSVDRESERNNLVSVDDRDVPPWQRQVVWTAEEIGLLALSILRNYPIGMMILWVKDDGIRVPIDGRQRLNAIKEFYDGTYAIPDMPFVPDEYRNKKYRLKPGDEDQGFTRLSVDDRDQFNDYELRIVEYESLDETTAMDIFVMLQGGKSLTKTEVRAALGGRLCDFVTELTTDSRIPDDEDDEPVPRHHFFRLLSKNLANRRKAHRNIADILLSEYLYPGTDKHWSSLEKMYREKAGTLSDVEKSGFRASLGRFQRSVTVEVNGNRILMPQLRSSNLILTIYRAFTQLHENYDLPDGFVFSEVVADFETERAEKPDELPWISFTAALSNAGYAQNRISTRHEILMTYILSKCPAASVKARDGNRSFSIEQKIAIWERAERRCEWEENGVRCDETFPNPREADADHVVRWADNGPTSIENGRLLCPAHNRGR